LEIEITTSLLSHCQHQDRNERDDKENKPENGEVQEPQTVELVHGTEQLIKQITFHFLLCIYSLNILCFLDP
jgi:hypothetical protein